MGGGLKELAEYLRLGHGHLQQMPFHIGAAYNMRALILLAVLTVVACSGNDEGFSPAEGRSLLKSLLNLVEKKKTLAITEKSLHAVSHDGEVENRALPRVFECTARSNGLAKLRLTGFPTGIIQSQAYGYGNYPNNAKCEWIICVPAGKVVQLTFTGTFDIEPAAGGCYDTVAMYNGQSSSSTLLARYCGTRRPSRVTSTGNCMDVLFATDSSDAKQGFRAEFQAVSSSGNVVTAAPTPAPTAAPTPAPTPAPAQGNSGLNPNNCGDNRFIKRIMNGYESAQGQWPWIAHIRTFTSSNSYMQCGGSLINNQWIVTAAHCLEYNGGWITEPSSIKVFLGEHGLDMDDDKDFQVTASKVIVSPYRTRQGVGPNDIALIKLTTPTSFNDYVNAVCTPTYTGQFAVGTSCFVSGWGKTHKNEGTSSQLLHVPMDIISNAECSQSYGSNIGDDVMCTKRHGSLSSACQGDSGGPLVCLQNGVYNLVGVVSFGAPCGQYAQTTPSVFASTEYFRSWISSTILNN